jgi:hypothetical protein
MATYRCIRCDETMADTKRARHSSSDPHIANGGSAVVVDEDYALVGDSPGNISPSGMGQTR